MDDPLSILRAFLTSLPPAFACLLVLSRPRCSFPNLPFLHPGWLAPSRPVPLIICPVLRIFRLARPFPSLIPLITRPPPPFRLVSSLPLFSRLPYLFTTSLSSIFSLLLRHPSAQPLFDGTLLSHKHLTSISPVSTFSIRRRSHVFVCHQNHEAQRTPPLTREKTTAQFSTPAVPATAVFSCFSHPAQISRAIPSHPPSQARISKRPSQALNIAPAYYKRPRSAADPLSPSTLTTNRLLSFFHYATPDAAR